MSRKFKILSDEEEERLLAEAAQLAAPEPKRVDVPALTPIDMLRELEFVGGDDMSDPSCHFCGAVGPHGAPGYVKYRPADPHEENCPLALAIGAPRRKS